jgi:glycosyltransferase involved in cell wall biosynthesis
MTQREPLPLVSAVIPVHDGARFLPEALRSVLEQGYPRLEIIVVDDGSTDESAAIARAHAGVLCLRQANGGVAAARNAGILASKGGLLAFLDQDDRWRPDKLWTQVSYLRDHPAVGYVLARQWMFLEPGTPHPSWLPRELLERDHVGHFPGTLVARRRVFDEVGLFNPTAPPAESADWFARAFDAGVPMQILPQVLLDKRIHGQNQSHDVARVRRGVLQALKASVDRKRRTR